MSTSDSNPKYSPGSPTCSGSASLIEFLPKSRSPDESGRGRGGHAGGRSAHDVEGQVGANVHAGHADSRSDTPGRGAHRPWKHGNDEAGERERDGRVA